MQLYGFDRHNCLLSNTVQSHTIPQLCHFHKALKNRCLITINLSQDLSDYFINGIIFPIWDELLEMECRQSSPKTNENPAENSIIKSF